MSNAVRATATASVAGFPEGAEGVTPPTNPEGTGGFLSDVIVELGFVDPETVERAVEAAREPGRRVDRILLETGALTEEELARALAERYGIDHVDLDQFEVDMGAARLISRSTALRYRAVPIAFATDGALIVAVADPVDALAISDVEVMTKSETRKAVASGSTIDALAERLPEVGARQPAANGRHAAGTVPPPSPGSPMVGANSQTSPSLPASEAPSDPWPADGSAAPSSPEAEIGELKPASEPTGIYAERVQGDQALERELRDERISSLEASHEAERAARQRLEQALEQAIASKGDADRERGEAEARSAALETELAEANDIIREQTGQGEAERGRLQEEVMEAAQERDRLREAVEQVTQERDRLIEEAQQASAKFASLLDRAARAESLAEEATGRIRELEDADRRAEAARLALTELREESEREREQNSRLERKLRDELTAAEERSASLERRLSGLMAAAAEAKAMAQELEALHGAITGDDVASESDGAPPATSAEP